MPSFGDFVLLPITGPLALYKAYNRRRGYDSRALAQRHLADYPPDYVINSLGGSVYMTRWASGNRVWYGHYSSYPKDSFPVDCEHPFPRHNR